MTKSHSALSGSATDSTQSSDNRAPSHPFLRRTILVAWSTALIGLLLGSLAGPGSLALRDMMVLDHPMLTPASLGFGDLPARNSPQDGLLALAGMLVPATWLARAWLLLSAVLAAGGAALLSTPSLSHRNSGSASLPGVLAAITLALWNPLVVERLLQGHWSLVAAIWTLPLLAALNLRQYRYTVFLLLWFCSLTPTGALLGITVAVVTAQTLRRRLGVILFSVLMSAPWVAPALLTYFSPTGLSDGSHQALSAGAFAFAPRAETYTGTLGALLGLGGIWNSDAVPASRQAGFALAGVALFALLVPLWGKIERPLVVLGVLGLGIPVLCWLLPELVGEALTHWTGAGLLRDSQKFLGLALPAYVAAASRLPQKWPWAALVLTVLQLPDAPLALRQLTPVTVQVAHLESSGRDVFDPHLTTLISAQDRVVVNPMTKAYSMVESGELTVDGQTVDLPSARFTQAQAAWAEGDLETLRDLNIGLVVDGEKVLADTGAPARSLTAGLVLLGSWLMIPMALLGACLCLSRRHKSTRQTARQSEST